MANQPTDPKLITSDLIAELLTEMPRLKETYEEAKHACVGGEYGMLSLIEVHIAGSLNRDLKQSSNIRTYELSFAQKNSAYARRWGKMSSSEQRR